MADQTDANTAEDAAAAEPASPSKKLRKKISVKRLLWMVVFTYLLFLVLLYFIQDKLIFHPTSDIIATPGTIGLAYEDVTILSEVKPMRVLENINAWYVPSKQNRGTVLFCHGNARNISYRLDMLDILHSLGYNCLMIDYRGFGKSDGKPSEQNMYMDVMAAWNYLIKEKKAPAHSIIVHGRSLGGGAASWLAAKLSDTTPPAGLVLESTFTSGVNIAQEKFWFAPVKYIAKFKFDTIGRINEIKCPILFIHSKDDRLIPVHHSKELFDAFNGDKEQVLIHGSHNAGFVVSGASYLNALKTFYDRVFGQGNRKAGAVAGKVVNE